MNSGLRDGSCRLPVWRVEAFRQVPTRLRPARLHVVRMASERCSISRSTGLDGASPRAGEREVGRPCGKSLSCWQVREGLAKVKTTRATNFTQRAVKNERQQWLRKSESNHQLRET